MASARRYKTPADATPGFAIKLTEDTQLGMAMLICEDEEGAYEPVGVASTISEAREIAQHHFRHRAKDMDGLCPYTYKVWAQGLMGDYHNAIEINPLA